VLPKTVGSDPAGLFHSYRPQGATFKGISRRKAKKNSSGSCWGLRF